MCTSCADKAAPRCAGCGKKFAPGAPIQQIGANKLQFHPECVKCSTCNKQITGGFKIESENPLKLKCGDCLQPNCSKCGNKIMESSWVLDNKKRPICTNCLPRCAVCGKGLAGEPSFTIPGMGSVHARCFKCARCNTNLASGGNTQFVKLNSGFPGCFDCRNLELQEDIQRENDRNFAEEERIRKKNQLEYHLRWHESDQITNREVLSDIGIDVSAVLGDKTVGAGQTTDIAEHVALVLDKQGLHVVPTSDPEAKINLDYLVVALRSYTEGDGRRPMAPVFSLDPVLNGSAADYIGSGKTNQDFQQKRLSVW